MELIHRVVNVHMATHVAKPWLPLSNLALNTTTTSQGQLNSLKVVGAQLTNKTYFYCKKLNSYEHLTNFVGASALSAPLVPPPMSWVLCTRFKFVADHLRISSLNHNMAISITKLLFGKFQLDFFLTCQ